jgi:hypothetical protein
MEHRDPPLTGPQIVMLALCAFSFGAIVRVAHADHYHVNCVEHGFVHGASMGDGSFFSRVMQGCGTGTKRCGLYTYGSFVGDLTVGGTSNCSAWSNDFGSFTECASTAHTYYSGVFGDHVHKAHNWCG